MMPLTIWTIGHSTRSSEAFIDLLIAHRIEQIADVRAFPYSRRHPQFHGAALAASLRHAGLGYRHFPLLGGRRKSRPDSVNLGWRHAGFRGYADYMHTEPFQEGLSELMQWATDRTTSIMCAEAVPWRCHRLLVADALISRGVDVRHIVSSTKANRHRLTPFASLEGGRLVYRSPNEASGLPLF